MLKYEKYSIRTIFTFVTVLSLLALEQNVMAECDDERNERDQFRNLCIPLSSASTLLAYLGNKFIPISLFGIPLGGLAGIPPGLVAHNQCRIWQEKENNLATCERNHITSQQLELEVQKRELEIIKKDNAIITEINDHFNQLEEDARSKYQIAVKRLMQGYMVSGKNVRNSEVQQELRKEVMNLEQDLSEELLRLMNERQAKMGVVS